MTATARPEPAAYQPVELAGCPRGYALLRFGRSAQYMLRGQGGSEVFFTLHPPGSSEFGSLVAWLVIQRELERDGAARGRPAVNRPVNSRKGPKRREVAA